MNGLNRELCNLVKSQLESFPFHNLGQLLQKKVVNGGTCFDHALKLRSQLIEAGIVATLHEAQVCLTGEKSHRLVRIEAEGEISFLDSGSGWPTVYQASSLSIEDEYAVAGINFSVVREFNTLLIKRRDGQNWREMNRISLAAQDEDLILDKFSSRYLHPLPYGNELRFCWLDNHKFHRISGFNLELFETGKLREVKRLSSNALLNYVNERFPELTFDLKMYLESIS